MCVSICKCVCMCVCVCKQETVFVGTYVRECVFACIIDAEGEGVCVHMCVSVCVCLRAPIDAE